MKRHISLKFLMITVMTLVLIVPIASLSILNYRDNLTSSRQYATQQLSILASDIKHATESRLIEVDNLMKHVSQDPEIRSGDPKRQRALLEKVVKMNPQFELLYVIGKNGIQTARSSGTYLESIDREDFKSAIQGNYFVTGSYISKTTGLPTVTFALPIKNEAGGIIGVIGGDLSLADLQALVKNVKAGEEGYAYLTDQNGVTIAHPKFSEYVLQQKNLKNQISVAESLSGKSGVTTWINPQGIEMYGEYLPINIPGHDFHWSVVVQIPAAELYTIGQNILLRNVEIGILLTVIAILFSYFLSNWIVKPVRQIIETTKKVSDGDLTRVLAYRTKTREFSQLRESINDMIAKLRDLLMIAQEHAGQVATASAQLSEGTAMLSMSANGIAATMQEMSAAHDHQSRQVETVAAETEKLRQEIQGILEKMNRVHELTAALNSEAKKSMGGVNQATKQMDTIQEMTRRSADQIQALEEKSQRIEEMVMIITNIAQQTHLLALNAAIEAARAGEYGRGFSIVADEVRKLAEQSSRAAEQITSVISEIHQETRLTVEEMRLGKMEAEKGTTFVRETLMSLEQISQSIQQIVHHTQDVADATERMNRSAEQVAGVAANLSSLSEETAAASEEVAASVEEESNTIHTLARSSEEMSRLANDLEQTVKKFKLHEATNHQL
ncbi:methyl-accepting chemotaxis sensory transducer [Collibacillus ludicampi]|uniref:Methyl-accepting chemotaxis sensory transducer n=1 Tax=Collibacillus ludicampi TaxID=2771369 RepID=A0AAV4LB26_9BACL|nr:methyl-accepting chemotaxis protein [Collibacillus ludicampi]GIM45002.1 methyl-accepting chemotaxis sensory transducer [Collibacillus ludicampi]